MRVKEGQSTLDVQLITAGSILGIVALCSLNDISITDELTDGEELTPTEVQDPRMKGMLSARNIQPATAIAPSTAEQQPGETPVPAYGGIGYMAVEIDFRIG